MGRHTDTNFSAAKCKHNMSAQARSADLQSRSCKQQQQPEAKQGCNLTSRTRIHLANYRASMGEPCPRFQKIYWNFQRISQPS